MDAHNATTRPDDSTNSTRDALVGLILIPALWVGSTLLVVLALTG